MNNVKFSNALIATADAVQSLTADYEGQLAQLRQTESSLVLQLKTSALDRAQGMGLLSGLESLVKDRLKSPLTTGEAAFCGALMDALGRSPWKPLPSPAESLGPLPPPHMSKASTPSA